jgi:DtxR family Mn-dependent transcriptional regulator
MSASKENFLKTVYQLGRDPAANTKPGSVARALHISQAATTDMARNLAAKGLLEYEKYQELKLTETGETEAIRIVRKHRLWETFLYKTLDISLHEIHREAEMLEHQTSDFLADKIAGFLNDPAVDPHGDPIPDQNGVLIADSDSIRLSRASEGEGYFIARLRSSSEDFFSFCSRHSISVGCPVKVLFQYHDTGITEAEIGRRVLLLGSDISSLIYVKQKL